MVTRIIDLARGQNTIVQKKFGLSRAEFERDHVAKSVPVVIGDATATWTAERTFTPERFCERFGDRRLDLDGKPSTVRSLFELLAKSDPASPAPYPCHYDMLALFPELAPEVAPRYAYADPDRTTHPLLPKRFLGCANTVEIFFGGPGGLFPYMHYDYMGLHAFISQLYGRKEFTVVAPEHAAYVYPDPNNPWRSLVENHHTPDLEKFPLFANAERLTFTIGPGETLFIPNGWWHTARSLDVTISVAIDMLNASNWLRFRNEVRALLKHSRREKRLAADVYLRALGSLLSVQEEVASTAAALRERTSRHVQRIREGLRGSDEAASRFTAQPSA